ncbi:DUF4097 family beta strand repeat-containing protein [Flavihumibacter petaseus]|uniref:DUF4097 domain-containing protein n=1 Tax=Flavihumibacter petaseus NBRC 106054 TaxID=1220578 RepID=A0A0E9MZQ6_9BACT|nr:DUF4097 family beta strand repeat-containing protein [Flavihumibacter petaseus]GAO43242.1 hypothetical protein FPE01S_02_03460 [Flavihumibacter petaseus NBRC 106054]
MKILLTFLSVLTVAGLVQAQDNAQKPYQVKKLSGSDQISAARMETSGGNLTVTGVDSDPRLEVYVRPNNNRDRSISDAEIKERLERDFDLSVSVTGGKLVAIARQKRNIRDWDKTVSISFRLYAPRQVSTDLTTSGGNISLEGITGGSQDFTTSGGNLDVKSVSGKIKGVTSGGNVHLENCSDKIDMATSGGNITASGSKGNLRLTTSGGNVNLNDLDGQVLATTSGGNVKGDNIGGELEASTSGGSVRLDNLRCSLEASTSGGNISVNMKELGKYVKLDNSGGNIDLEIPSGKGLDLALRGDKIKTSTLNNFKGDVDDNSIKGSINGGGIPVDIRASSGRITLTMR